MDRQETLNSLNSLNSLDSLDWLRPLLPFARLRSTCLGTLILAAACVPGEPGPEARDADSDPVAAAATTRDGGEIRVLDGTEKSFVVVGYSTSYAWPEMLQEMLDEHAGDAEGERTYHVLNAVIGGSPVGRWIASPETDDYQETYGRMVRDFFGPDPRLRGDAPVPTVAILQHSLQRTPTPDTRLGPVTAADDEEGIRIGADALEQLVGQLREDGIEDTFIATHIYKEGFEPEVGNERFALAALLQRGHPDIHEGPDVWSPTIAQHPAAYAEDRLHPDELGAEIMAEEWYRALAGAEAREEVVEAMYERDWDVEAMRDDYLAWRATADDRR